MPGRRLVLGGITAISSCVAVATASNEAGAVPTTETFELQVTGQAGIPRDAEAVVLNVTATNTEAAGFVTVWPCGQAIPEASNLNFVAGRDVPNLVISRVGVDGKVCLKASANTNLIADAAGYFPAGSDFEPAASPTRILDTRNGTGAPLGLVAAGGTVKLQVAGTAGVPAGADAVVMNVTAASTQEYGFVTAYPCDEPLPVASNLNFVAGQDVPNLVASRLAGDGSVCLYTYGSTHLIADVAGHFPAGSDYEPITNPTRVLDTRSGLGAPAGSVPAGHSIQLRVGGVATVPPDAEAVVVNVTVAEAQAPGFVTVYPCGQPVPNASNLNYSTGQDIPNLVITRLGDGGSVCLYTYESTQLIADVAGYFRSGSSYVPLTTPTRILDSRNPPPAAAVGFPSGVSADRRLIVDQNGQAWPMLADAAWMAMNQLRPAEMLQYLDGIKRHGYNAVQTMLISEAFFSANSPGNYAGEAPFTGSFFSSPVNEPYWQWVDWVVEQSAARGITLVFAAAYSGNSSTDGVHDSLVAASDAQARAYGEFIGQRYRDAPNIMWVIGGDREFYAGTPIYDRYENLVAGIRAQDTRHLITAHPGPELRADQQFDETWLDVNAIYNNKYEEVVDFIAPGWNDSPTRPVVYIEPAYEHEAWAGTFSHRRLRYQEYGSFAAGAVGLTWGNNPRWHFDGTGWFGSPGTWQESLDDPDGDLDRGSIEFSFFAQLLRGVDWARTHPDTSGTFLTAGAGSGTSRAAVRFDTTLAVLYMPSARSVTLDLTEMSSSQTVRIRAYDPTSGVFTSLGTFPTTGSHTIPALGNNAGGDSDWVLVVDGVSV